MDKKDNAPLLIIALLIGIGVALWLWSRQAKTPDPGPAPVIKDISLLIQIVDYDTNTPILGHEIRLSSNNVIQKKPGPAAYFTVKSSTPISVIIWRTDPTKPAYSPEASYPDMPFYVEYNPLAASYLQTVKFHTYGGVIP